MVEFPVPNHAPFRVMPGTRGATTAFAHVTLSEFIRMKTSLPGAVLLSSARFFFKRRKSSRLIGIFVQEVFELLIVEILRHPFEADEPFGINQNAMRDSADRQIGRASCRERV